MAVITPVFLLFLNAGNAQHGYSSGTMGMMQSQDYVAAYTTTQFESPESKDRFREAGIRVLLPNHIVPEEILNYHTHRIAMPEKGQQISLVPEITPHPFLKDHYLMQVGIASDTVIPIHRGAIGLMYVLDISGSMEGERLESAKKALVASLGILKPTDYAGVVIFDDLAEIRVSYGLVGNRKAEMIRQVEALHTRGGTNILAGLNKGLDEMKVLDRSDIPQTLVILTDGNTNLGSTAKEDILAEISLKTKNNIRITTMGIGIDLRYDLLRDISQRSHGQFHYIERAADIQKVCVNEFASVAMPIGKQTRLVVQLPDYLELAHVYGSDSVRIEGATIEISLEDLNYSLTQVVMLDLKFNPNFLLNPSDLKTELSYTSFENQKEVVLDSPTQLLNGAEGEEVLYTDLLKNFLIADWAYGFRNASEAYFSGKDKTVLESNLKRLLGNPLTQIEALKKDVDVLRLKKVFEDLTLLLG